MPSTQLMSAKSCPDLQWIDQKIRTLKDELRGGYDHPAGVGYTIIEIKDLIEEYRDRYMRYVNENPLELAIYLAEKAGEPVNREGE